MCIYTYHIAYGVSGDTHMRGSRNFRQWGPGPSDKKTLTTFLSVLHLFYRSQKVTFEENYHFPRFQRALNNFQGVGDGSYFSG